MTVSHPSSDSNTTSQQPPKMVAPIAGVTAYDPQFVDSSIRISPKRLAYPAIIGDR
jgi:hypothetical protein